MSQTLAVFRALLGRKEDDEPEEGVLFALPEDPVPSCVPTCDWCGMQGPPIPADLGVSKRYGFGRDWGAMVGFALISVDEHKRTACTRADEHPEDMARLLSDRDPFTHDDEDVDDALDLEEEEPCPE